MTIKSAGVSGCCVARYYYDIGSAHGHPPLKTIDELADQLAKTGYSSVNTVWLNANQKIEKEFLKGVGFKVVYKSGGMTLLAANAKDLDDGLKEAKSRLAQKAKEEQEKRVEVQREVFRQRMKNELRPWPMVYATRERLVATEGAKPYTVFTHSMADDLYYSYGVVPPNEVFAQIFPDYDFAGRIITLGYYGSITTVAKEAIAQYNEKNGIEPKAPRRKKTVTNVQETAASS